jgi:DNA-binding MarR family transcriptional regulator
LFPVKRLPARDHADEIAEFWCRENPDVDPVTKTIAIRLRRAALHLERELRRELAVHDMDMWAFEVLLSLRRSPEYTKSAGTLLKESKVTSGAITNRVAQLENRGWVRRQMDPADRRQVLVSLTPEGLRRADQLVATKTEAEQRLLGGIDRRTLERLAGDLRTVLVAMEGPAEQSPDGISPPGSTQAPATTGTSPEALG